MMGDVYLCRFGLMSKGGWFSFAAFSFFHCHYYLGQGFSVEKKTWLIPFYFYFYFLCVCGCYNLGIKLCPFL